MAGDLSRHRTEDSCAPRRFPADPANPSVGPAEVTLWQKNGAEVIVLLTYRGELVVTAVYSISVFRGSYAALGEGLYGNRT